MHTRVNSFMAEDFNNVATTGAFIGTGVMLNLQVLEGKVCLLQYAVFRFPKHGRVHECPDSTDTFALQARRNLQQKLLVFLPA